MRAMVTGGRDKVAARTRTGGNGKGGMCGGSGEDDGEGCLASEELEWANGRHRFRRVEL